MKKKFISLIAATAVMLSVSGCFSDVPEQTTTAARTDKIVQTDQPATEQITSAAVTEETTRNDPAAPGNVQPETDGMLMKVNGSTGKMDISRAEKKSAPMGEKGTWTIFVYLCGTDLESGEQYGASIDFYEMILAEGSDNVRFVVETGGTSEWSDPEMIPSDKICRYVIQNQDYEMVDTCELTSMGDPDTLSDFLNWGVSEYPADKMGVIIWDHGGGSISGVCFDEMFDDDSLSLSEIDDAFSAVYKNMTDRFEFIGFDACLMATVEAANVLATYARYMYASQEIEPITGWSFDKIGTFLAGEPDADGSKLGKVVTYSYFESCEEADDADECTFSVIDLDKFDDFVVEFNDYSHKLYDTALDDVMLGGIVKNAKTADNFGGNNKAEGYTNMVDLGGIIKACSEYADNTAVMEAFRKCILYNRTGKVHDGAMGLSIYYPLHIEGSAELKIFSEVCLNPYYLSLVDMIAKGYDDNDYNNSVFFGEDGYWVSGGGHHDTYFSYADEENHGSSLITFEVEPHLDDDGNYSFILDDDGYTYTSTVDARISLDLAEGYILELGETNDVDMDWLYGEFSDNFDGLWIALPDGSLLAMYIAEYADDYVVCTSPVYVNDNLTNLRIRIYDDYTLEIEGTWDGIGENGMAAREIKRLKAGDEICAVMYIVSSDGERIDYVGDPYIWEAGDELIYNTLPEGEYNYGFVITDIYGDEYTTDTVVFSMDDDGYISFYI